MVLLLSDVDKQLESFLVFDLLRMKIYMLDSFQVVWAFPGSMEANRSQNGIQLLLAAEQEAQHIVNAAKNGTIANLAIWIFLVCAVLHHVFWDRGTSVHRLHTKIVVIYADCCFVWVITDVKMQPLKCVQTPIPLIQDLFCSFKSHEPMIMLFNLYLLLMLNLALYYLGTYVALVFMHLCTFLYWCTVGWS